MSGFGTPAAPRIAVQRARLQLDPALRLRRRALVGGVIRAVGRRCGANAVEVQSRAWPGSQMPSGSQRSSERMCRELYWILWCRHSRLGGEQRVGEARLSFVETLGMKRFLEREELVIEMVAKLVGERAQDRLEGHYLSSRGRAHPDGDSRPGSPFLGFIETVQLAVVPRRPPRHHAHADRRHFVTADECVDQALTGSLHTGAILGDQRSAYLRHRRPDG